VSRNITCECVDALVSFPGGLPPNLKDSRIPMAKTLEFENDFVKFTSPALVSDTSKYAVGMYNSRTGTLKLIPARGVFAMEQVVKLQQEQDESLRNQVRDRSGVNQFAQYVALTEKFGNQKSKRKVRERLLNSVGLEDESARQTLGKIAKIAHEKNPEPLDQDEAVVLNREALLPPFNAAASSVHDAYPIATCKDLQDLDSNL